MKIEKKYSKFAVKYTYDKMIEVGVELDKEMLDSFKSVLEDRAARKNMPRVSGLHRRMLNSSRTTSEF